MKDFGSSSDPAVQAQLNRLARLSLPQGRLGLDTVRELLRRMGDPHLRLPPVFHVAGTNGKGSVCAFLRAMLEADGKTVHVATSPHLARYNERIRVAGTLISNDRLADLLREVLDAAEGLGPSFYEVTIAAAFTEFARVPADACIVEVGVGGRFDATNVLPPEVLAACGIAALGIDHERFLLTPEDGVPTEPLARIAFEKAGIAKNGVPLVTLDYPEGPRSAIKGHAAQIGAPVFSRGLYGEWAIKPTGGGASYVDDAGSLALPHASLTGRHQVLNAGLAIAMLRHQKQVTVSEPALVEGLQTAKWPARLQRLSDGPLTRGRVVWLDGGHNRDAGDAIAIHFKGQKLHLIVGMIEAKDPQALIEPLGDSIVSLIAVPIASHETHPAEAYGANITFANTVPDALAEIPDDGVPVLIAGSLYLAGEVLRLNDEIPD